MAEGARLELVYRLTPIEGSNPSLSAIEITSVVRKGNSGGPIFDANGNVLGDASLSIDNSLNQDSYN